MGFEGKTKERTCFKDGWVEIFLRCLNNWQPPRNVSLVLLMTQSFQQAPNREGPGRSLV